MLIRSVSVHSGNIEGVLKSDTCNQVSFLDFDFKEKIVLIVVKYLHFLQNFFKFILIPFGTTFQLLQIAHECCEHTH